MISIVIPTLNEEQQLPVLLESIKSQDFTDYEIIVADAGSKDKTCLIAKSAGATVVKGGMPGVGRNAGAQAATGDFLFFLDADVKLPQGFLRNAYDELEERYLELATCASRPMSDFQIDKILYDIANISIKATQFSDPHAPGYCILCTKRLFNRVRGFDETLTIAEDHDFVKRASAFRPLRVLENTHIIVSTRRLDKEGRIKLVRKYAKVELHRIFRGEIRDDTIDYDFEHIAQANSDEQLKRIERRIRNVYDELSAFLRKNHVDIITTKVDEQFGKVKKGISQSTKKLFSLLKK